MPKSTAKLVLMTLEIRAGVLHASGRPFSAYSFRPVKEYVAVGGRNPRVLGQSDADDQDRGRCAPPPAFLSF